MPKPSDAWTAARARVAALTRSRPTDDPDLLAACRALAEARAADVARSMTARLAAHKSWARTPNRSASTANARAALLARFERDVDPDGVLAPQERARRAESARKAHYVRMALRSAQSRRRGRALLADDGAADVELADLGGGAA